MREISNEAMKLLTPKQRKEVGELVKEADIVFARNRINGGMIHSFFYDCVNGGILKAKKKPDHYVNNFNDFYIDSRVGGGGRRELNNILEQIKLVVDTKFKPCSICGIPTEKKAKEQIKEVTEVRMHHYETWGKERGEKKPEPAVLSEQRLFHRALTKDSYVCYICCQNELTKGG